MCYRHQLLNTVIQETFTHHYPHYLHHPTLSASKKYLMYRTNWSARLITTAKWQKKNVKKKPTQLPTLQLWFGCCECCAFISWNCNSSHGYRRFPQCASWSRGCYSGRFLYAFNRVQQENTTQADKTRKTLHSSEKISEKKIEELTAVSKLNLKG